MIPPGEKIVETKICPIMGTEFHVTDKEIEFYDSVSPVINGKKYVFPPPTLCFEARQQRQMSWSNELYLYKNTCALTGKQIVSEYAPENPRPVWGFRDWFSDTYDPLKYGREVDLSKSILEQLYEREKTVPHPNVATDLMNENSDYTHQA